MSEHTQENTAAAAGTKPAPVDPSAASVVAPTEIPPPSFKYFRPPSATHPHLADLPDSYFKPSTAELKAQQTALSKRTQALVNAPLRTAAMREAEEKARKARWPHTTVRVRFADRSMLERTFASTEKIKAVYAFVRGSLREDVKPIKFVLYQTPPKREFKVSDPAVRNLSLVDLQLAPASILLLKFEDDALNHPDVPAPLAPSVLALAEDLPAPPNFDADAAASAGASSGNTLDGKAAEGKGKGKAAEGEPLSREDKLKKFLKLGPKK